MIGGTVFQVRLTAEGEGDEWTATMLSREAFIQEFAELRVLLEKRRKHYLLFFYGNALLAIVLLVAAFWYPHTILTWLAGILHRSTPVTALESASLMFFACFCAVALICTPLLRYRGSLKAEYSLPKMLLIRLCEWLGDATPTVSGASFVQEARGCGMFPADAGISEQAGIRGVVNNITYYIQEMAVSSALSGANMCVFRGFFLVCRRPQPRTVLHYEQHSRTLVLHREHVVSDLLISQGWEKTEYVTMQALEVLNLACVTTHLADAQSIVTESWLSALQVLAQQASAIIQAKKENQALCATQNYYTSIKKWFAARKERPAIEAELVYDAQFCSPPNNILITRQSEQSPFNNSFGISYVSGAYIVALPCAAPLFMMPSLFEPSFTEAQAIFLYDMVYWLGVYTPETQKYPSESLP